MKLFDLHCDTLCAAYDRGEDFARNSCQVSLDKAFSVFDEYRQVTATTLTARSVTGASTA